MAEDKGSMTGLTEDEALEFHKYYIQGFGIFTAVAALAHLLVWSWRPWIPDDDGYAMLEGVQTALTSINLFG